MQKVGQNVVCDTGDVSPGQFSDHKQGESDLLIRLRLPSRSGDSKSADGDYNDVNMRAELLSDIYNVSGIWNNRSYCFLSLLIQHSHVMVISELQLMSCLGNDFIVIYKQFRLVIKSTNKQ